MARTFDDATRRNIAELCAAFTRLAPAGAAPTLKRAAVAIALTEGDDGSDTAFLLTRRSASLHAHSAQWALPGGRCDAGETQAQAALRELHEELGLSLDNSAVLGMLDDYPTRSGYLITPVVVWAGRTGEIVPNPDEVASVHRIGLDAVEAADAFTFVSIPESVRRVIRFRLGGQLIHAPTAALIYQFREVLAGRDTRVADLEQPVFAWK
ncbi:CoA pyrophosphatase [Bradyrhizobium sp. ISRA443]|uniref:NUDIX hydrolase n=1 Tax=unclassified Bradyrhizobium TaxID=2631580 RepID=UPI0024785651|nr:MULTISPECIES: CoA pyrophosphatase [unclassified Bradyrhizobium]WGR95311.1 CoA pyrophosphatase [Bradyrhizobium sp. ISRA435]WGS00282.1 CoA pyrophosphatase [Bradyrhizobium sp. ISRA436]WGS07171.1 CoA pyrophosphatase [Bradyrhizobium sp. ISRA437]WGS14056.1 CoA pyrophosphatase [Bradyrhizobium sp. ISRA443]